MVYEYRNPTNYLPPWYDRETDRLGLVPKPEPTNYRPAKVVVLKYLPEESVEYMELSSMKEKDDAFVEQLINKDYHDMFWHFTAIKWVCSTSAEKEARQSFQQAIENRYNLIILQKVLLGTVFPDVAENDREELCELVQGEMVEITRWINTIPKSLRREYERACGSNNFLEESL